MNFDLSGDWQYIDNVEAVTLCPRQAGDGFATIPVTAALRLPTEKTYVDASGLLVKAELEWDLWKATFTDTTRVPKPRDVIQDSANVRWSIVRVAIETFSTRYRCLTVRER